jgi:hypothetical protein
MTLRWAEYDPIIYIYKRPQREEQHGTNSIDMAKLIP